MTLFKIFCCGCVLNSIPCSSDQECAPLTECSVSITGTREMLLSMMPLESLNLITYISVLMTGMTNMYHECRKKAHDAAEVLYIPNALRGSSIEKEVVLWKTGTSYDTRLKLINRSIKWKKLRVKVKLHMTSSPSPWPMTCLWRVRTYHPRIQGQCDSLLQFTFPRNSYVSQSKKTRKDRWMIWLQLPGLGFEPMIS